MLEVQVQKGCIVVVVVIVIVMVLLILVFRIISVIGTIHLSKQLSDQSVSDNRGCPVFPKINVCKGIQICSRDEKWTKFLKTCSLQWHRLFTCQTASPAIYVSIYVCIVRHSINAPHSNSLDNSDFAHIYTSQFRKCHHELRLHQFCTCNGRWPSRPTTATVRVS